MVIWITGLSGAGKTSVGKSLIKIFKKKINFIWIDGDTIRSIFPDKLSYDVQSRIVQIKRIQAIAKLLSDQKFSVIVTALYSNHQLLQWNKDNFKDYFEVYIKRSMDSLIKSDPKNIYKRFEKGLEKNVVGCDIKWIEPVNSDITIMTENYLNSKDIAADILQKIKEKNNIFL